MDDVASSGIHLSIGESRRPVFMLVDRRDDNVGRRLILGGVEGKCPSLVPPVNCLFGGSAEGGIIKVYINGRARLGPAGVGNCGITCLLTGRLVDGDDLSTHEAV